ncbi:MAG: endolytic transglycosylase MltG [Tissierellia bacterium]|nr:endolytic transglycosylase MltG [Tissierellia bacterium]
MSNKKEKKKGSILKYIFIFLILVIAFGAFTANNYYKQSIGPMDKDNVKEITVEVPSGSSTDKISSILLDNGLIKNKTIFKFQVKSLEADGKLKAGTFNLNTGMDVEEIVENLSVSQKSTNTVRFTIPEGYELTQIAEKLAKEEIVDEARFLELTGNKSNFEDKYEFLKLLEPDQSLEGFLFPSTYEIYKDSEEKVVIEKMLDQFAKIYEKDIAGKLEEMNLSLNEVITLASIVEREGKVDSERPIMSAVFHNRIDQNMALQSCATVQYILGERKEVLTNEDTRIPSLYNTYIHTGLPPGPIASPGEASLIAAVNPADVDYLFFVLTGSDGTHTFTKTYQEHLNAKPK